MVESKKSKTGGDRAGLAKATVQKGDDPYPGKTKPLGDKPFSSTVPAYEPPTPKAEARPEPKDAPWNPPFPPPADGNYEVKWADNEVVKANRRNGVWKLKDGRAIQVHGWR